MATGQSDSRDAVATRADPVSERLDGAAFATIVLRPTATDLIAGAILAGAVDAPTQLRVLSEQRTTPSVAENAVVATDHGMPGVDAALDPIDPIAEALDRGPSDAFCTTLDREGEPGAGIVTHSTDLATAIARSPRLYGPLSGSSPSTIRERLEAAGLPTTVEGIRNDPSRGRDLATWVTAMVLESSERPTSASTALESICRPRYVDGPSPTVEGLFDVLDTCAEVCPGMALGYLLTGTGWAALVERHDRAMAAVHDAVSALPIDQDGPLAVAEAPAVPLEPTAFLWTGYRLHEPYGMLVRGESPARVHLVSTGDRAASALLEATTTSCGGYSWGDSTSAGAVVDADRAGVVAAVEDEL